MIEVFATNIEERHIAARLVNLLLQHFPGSRINFDLDDCDRILRVEGKNFTADGVILLVKESGFACAVLD